MIKILLGGSPCTHWSIAKGNGRETKAEGIGWELFLNYVIAKEKFKPDFFLYENNKSAAEAIKQQIQKELGAPLMYIDSALVSAQSRKRFYVFNWQVDQPEDRGILLKDILESNTVTDRDKSRCVTSSVGRTTTREYFNRHQNTMAYETAPKHAQILNINPSGKGMNGAVIHTNGKSRTLTTNKGEGQKIIEPLRVGEYPQQNGEISPHQSKQYRIYSQDGKACTQCGQGGGMGAKTGLYAIPINGCEHDQISLFAPPTQEQRTVGVGYRNRRENDGKLYRRFETSNAEKSNCLTTVQSDAMVAEPITDINTLNSLKNAPTAVAKQVVGRKKNAEGIYERSYEARTDGKANTLTSVESRRLVAEPITNVNRLGGLYNQSTRWGIYDTDHKAPTLCAAAGMGGGHVPMFPEQTIEQPVSDQNPTDKPQTYVVEGGANHN